MQKVFYSNTTVAPMIKENIYVIPHQSYLVDVEIVHSDTDNENEYADITFDGQDFGRCNPNGHEFKCTWHNCSEENHGSNVPRRSINSTFGIIKFEAAYSRNVDADPSCNANGVKWTAIVRVTLTPYKEKGN